MKHSLSYNKLQKSFFVVLKWRERTGKFQVQFSLFDRHSPNTPPSGYLSLSLHWKSETLKCLWRLPYAGEPETQFVGLRGSILNVETERNVFILSPLQPVVTQSLLRSEDSLRVADNRHGPNMWSARAAQITRSHLLMDHRGRQTRSNVPWHSEQCVGMMKTYSCCLLSASRPTSLTGTLSTTSMRTTLETFGNFQSKTVVNVLCSCIHTGGRTCLQWACKDSCCAQHLGARGVS